MAIHVDVSKYILCLQETQGIQFISKENGNISINKYEKQIRFLYMYIYIYTYQGILSIHGR